MSRRVSHPHTHTPPPLHTPPQPTRIASPTRAVPPLSPPQHGIAFLALFTAFQTSSAYQATVLKDLLNDPTLGFEALAIIYVVFSFSNFVSPPIVAALGARLSMFLGGMGYALYILAFLHPSRHLILAAAAVLGLSAAVIWTAQGHFITQCSDESNRGMHSGLFWAMLQCSLLIGNLIGYFVLPDLDGSTPADIAKFTPIFHHFYLVLFIAACAGVCVFLLLRKPVVTHGGAEAEKLLVKCATQPAVPPAAL